MECWHCERPSHATCKFCGRAVCKAHAKELPSIFHTFKTRSGTYKALVVSGAIWCGICDPKQDPISLPSLD